MDTREYKKNRRISDEYGYERIFTTRTLPASLTVAIYTYIYYTHAIKKFKNSTHPCITETYALNKCIQPRVEQHTFSQRGSNTVTYALNKCIQPPSCMLSRIPYAPKKYKGITSHALIE